jgi:hypothetical protein
VTRYCYDTEFLEDGSTIELISIGIVADDGREYYAVNVEAPWKRIYRHGWLCDNVIPSLPQIRGDRRNHVPVRSNPHALDFQHRDMKKRRGIATDVQRFLLAGDTAPELWAYYSAYDHVALCQLWGRMIDLPDGIPMYTHDLKQEIDRLGMEPPEQESGLHNALADARWVDASLAWLESQVSS